MPDKDEITTGLYSILSLPVIYLMFEKLMGSNHKYRMYVDKFIATYKNARIIDIGCGAGKIIDFLPPNIEYVGYDRNSTYINFAKKKYGHRANFYNKRVSKMALAGEELFDIVLADGLLHHLNDDEADQLFKTGYEALKPNGFMLTVDPIFLEGQHFVARFISSNDRGQHVRFPHEQEKIARKTFANVETHVIPNIGKRPQTGCIIKCIKA